MEKVRYMISDAAAAVNVETHVLRYWEDELGLLVPRNEMGHRYYTRENIQEFQKIKELKEKGYQLRAIKSILHGQGESIPNVSPMRTPEARMDEFRELMAGIVGNAIAQNNEELSMQITTEVQEKILKEINYLMREQDNQQEERFKKLDSAIRGNIRKKPLLFRKHEKKDKLKPVHIVE